MEKEKRSDVSSATAAQPEAPLAEDDVEMRTELFCTELGIEDAPTPQEEPQNMDVQRTARRSNFRILDFRRRDTSRNRVEHVNEERPDENLGTDHIFSRDSNEVLRLCWYVNSNAGTSCVHKQEKKDDQRTSVARDVKIDRNS